MSSTPESGPAAVVFDPSPLLGIEIEEGPRGKEVHLHGGGQGIWITRMIARLGIPARLCTAVGDDPGRVLHTLLRAEGISLLATDISGATATFVHERREGERIVLAEIESPSLSRHEMDDLYDRVLVAGLEAGVVVFAGPRHEEVISPDFYRRLALDLGTNTVPVVADLSGRALMAALEGGIAFLKVSHEEARDAGILDSCSEDAAVAAVRHLQKLGATSVVLTRAEEPAIARVGDETFRITPPRLEVLDHRGAGDSMTAGLAVGILREMLVEDVLRLGTAAGSLNVTRHGLGTGQRQEIEALQKHVTIEKICS